MRPRSAFTLFVLTLAGAVGPAACTDDLARAGLAQGCKLNSDCAEGLLCTSRICHAVCASTRDCPAGTLCVRSKDGTICQLEKETGCSSAADCIDSLVCGNDGTCRNECATKDDCISPQICASGGFCAESTEVDPQTQKLPNASGRDGGTSSGGAGGTGTGGSSTTGGAPATGGSGATGGRAATGGATGTGGASSTGGEASTGGASATGGASSTGGASPLDAASDAPELVTLTILDPLGWCSYAVESGAPQSSMSILSVPKGSVVHLSATPSNATFVFGYWTGTDGETNGKDTQASTTVTMSVNKTVLACCPFVSDPTTPCPG